MRTARLSRWTRALPVVAVLLMVGVGDAEAQESRRRGFWVGFGLGPGWNTSEGLDDGRRAGFSGYLRMGGTISRKVLLGGEVIGWGRDDDGTTVGRGNVTVTALFYPKATGSFFLKGGVGGSSVEVKRENVSVTDTGFGLTLGTGWNVRLGQSLSLTPNVDFLFQAFDAGENLQSTNTMLILTLGLTFH